LRFRAHVRKCEHGEKGNRARHPLHSIAATSRARHRGHPTPPQQIYSKYIHHGKRDYRIQVGKQSGGAHPQEHRQARIAEGDSLAMAIESDGSITLRSARRRYNLNELVSKITPRNRPSGSAGSAKRLLTRTSGKAHSI
jgi:hypothetical protein